MITLTSFHSSSISFSTCRRKWYSANLSVKINAPLRRIPVDELTTSPSSLLLIFTWNFQEKKSANNSVLVLVTFHFMVQPKLQMSLGFISQKGSKISPSLMGCTLTLQLSATLPASSKTGFKSTDAIKEHQQITLHFLFLWGDFYPSWIFSRRSLEIVGSFLDSSVWNNTHGVSFAKLSCI